jgi:hypothetical protein
MLKRGLAAMVAVSAVVTFVTSEAVGREGNQNWRSGSERDYQNYDRQRSAPVRRGQYDPSSYDGRRTGQPRTCGHDFFLRDGRGATMGPYCN